MEASEDNKTTETTPEVTEPDHDQTAKRPRIEDDELSIVSLLQDEEDEVVPEPLPTRRQPNFSKTTDNIPIWVRLTNGETFNFSHDVPEVAENLPLKCKLIYSDSQIRKKANDCLFDLACSALITSEDYTALKADPANIRGDSTPYEYIRQCNLRPRYNNGVALSDPPWLRHESHRGEALQFIMLHYLEQAERMRPMKTSKQNQILDFVNHIFLSSERKDFPPISAPYRPFTTGIVLSAIEKAIQGNNKDAYDRLTDYLECLYAFTDVLKPQEASLSNV